MSSGTGLHTDGKWQWKPRGLHTTSRPSHPLPPQLFLNIPQPLKKHLQDQQARITSGASLPPLPADPSVFDILADYRATLSKPTDALTPEEEAALALGAYFDKVLPKRLLYKEEQAQAQEV